MRLEDQIMSHQGDFRVTGRPGAKVLRFTPFSEAARTFVDANVELKPSQWHKGSFSVEHRFARDLADLLTDEGFDVWDGRATGDGKYRGWPTDVSQPAFALHVSSAKPRRVAFGQPCETRCGGGKKFELAELSERQPASHPLPQIFDWKNS